MEGLASAVKQLQLSEGSFFSHRVIKGYPVSTLVWTDKTTLQKYVSIWVEVPVCTKAVNLDPMPYGQWKANMGLDQQETQGSQQTTEAQREDFNSKVTRYTEAAEICKCQAVTGELLLGLPFECDCNGFLSLSQVTQQNPFVSLQHKSLIQMTTRTLTLCICSSCCLKCSKNLIVVVAITEEDTTRTSQAKM